MHGKKQHKPRFKATIKLFEMRELPESPKLFINIGLMPGLYYLCHILLSGVAD